MTANLKYIDLFAGCGGLSTGLHQAGWQGLFAVEKNISAFTTLKANLVDKKKHFDWPEWLPQTNWDIKELLQQKADKLAKLKGTVDLVVGGPPCQGFSTAGMRREGDERNNLVHSYLSLVELVQPRAILFENVRGFTMKFKANAQEGLAYSQLVIQKLQELGYKDAKGELIDMSDYGVPQRRQRYIVIATLENLAEAAFKALKRGRAAHLLKRGIPRKNDVKSALSDLLRSHGCTPCPDSKGFQSGVTSRRRTGLQKHLRSDETLHTPDSHRFVNHTKDVAAVFSKLLASAPRNRCILGEEREEFGLKKRSVTVLDGDRSAPTVTTIPDDFVHYSEPRVMTVRECARLQTFPDWFEFKGPYTTGGKQRLLQTPRYTQVGNAVPPLFAEKAGLALKEILSHVECSI
ncbi:DNA cytosine methyltransferase [Prosthecobacter sp.]|uniref:DNA cytosine methyltransferase n=1 Tax=Prosthecobacter sp. TaxID=1965333 RepID=UPI00378448EB